MGNHTSSLGQSCDKFLVSISKSDISHFNIVNLIQSAQDTRAGTRLMRSDSSLLHPVISQELLNFLLELSFQRNSDGNTIITVTTFLAEVFKVPLCKLLRWNGELNSVVSDSHSAHVPLQLIEFLFVVKANNKPVENEAYENTR